MATLPAYNPEIPYLGLIPGGVRAGTMIRVKGSMNYGGHRFMISLQTGAALRPRDDTAFQLSVRPAEQVIVRNHYENNVWGTEERFGGCPINPNPGQPFEILILVETTGYKISINGNHFCHFHHRFSMYKVTFIAVESDITVTSITMGTDIPSAPPAPPPMPVPIQPYPPHITYPGHGHRPQYPHYPHYPGHGHPPGHVYPGPPQIPGYVPGPPPPPPYSPTPYPGHRYPYVHPMAKRSELFKKEEQE